MPLDPLLGYTLAQSGVNLASTSSNAESSGSKNPAKTSYRYPLASIGKNNDYLEIKVFRYVLPTEGSFRVTADAPYLTVQNYTERLSKSREEPLYYINLPIPQNISDSSSVSWGDDTINPLEAFGLGVANAGQENPISAAQQAASAITGQIKGVDNKTLGIIKNAISGQAVNAAGGNVSVSGLISRATGQVLNSNLELLFQGVNLRSFPFVFDFAPRSPDEAQEVKNIIRIFKKAMTPKAGGVGGTSSGTGTGLFITAPNTFKLQYKTGNSQHRFLNTFKPCALTDMSVNYTASGTYATYSDGTPVHIQMTLSFKEINPIYADDYDSGDARIGVGY